LISTQQIKLIRALHQKKYRDKYDLFIAEGFKLVNEALSSVPSLIKFLAFTSQTQDQINIHKVHKNTSLLEVTEKEFNKFTLQTTPQGILAVLKKPLTPLPEPLEIKDISLVLDKIQDPGNFGTIIRLADWFGMNQIFCSMNTVDCYNAKVVQASMGAIFRVNIHYIELKEFLNEIKQNKTHHIYGTSLNGSNLFTTNLQKPALIILGNESGGMDDNLIDVSEKNLLIPNYSNYKDKSESLNVSMAAAIICAELRRQTS